MKVYCRRAKPGAWPHQLYRVVGATKVNPALAGKRVQVLTHGIWGGYSVGNDPITSNDINTWLAKGELHELDVSLWGETIDDRIPKFIEKQDLDFFFPTHQLGVVADGKWNDVSFSIVSRTVFNIHGRLFQWVQRSDSGMEYENYPSDQHSVIWVNPETSLFTTAVAAEKKWEEWSLSARGNLLSQMHLRLYDGPTERINKNRRWTNRLRTEAKELIIAKQRKEQEKEARQKREEEERKRREEEERKAAAKRVEEKRKAERERLKELMNKPASELSPEEFAKRMQMKRAQKERNDEPRT